MNRSKVAVDLVGSLEDGTVFDDRKGHAFVTDDEQVDTILGPGGALEAFKEARAEGKVKYLGFSAHDEDAALRMVASDEFDT